jgi:hypothetical protein
VNIVTLQANIKAIMLDGLVAEAAPIAGKGAASTNYVWSDADALTVLGGGKGAVEVVRAQATDAATGACVLSAAELSSSKQYLQRADGEWAVAYMVRHCRPVCSCRRVGL